MVIIKLFTEYVAAYSTGNEDLADFLFTRFRPEMKLATEAWIETQPLINPDAPATPFELAEYQSTAQIESDRLLKEAVDHLDDAHKANQRSDRPGFICITNSPYHVDFCLDFSYSMSLPSYCLEMSRAR